MELNLQIIAELQEELGQITVYIYAKVQKILLKTVLQVFHR